MNKFLKMKTTLILLLFLIIPSIGNAQFCDTTRIFQTVHEFPSGLATDGNLIWTTGLNIVFEDPSIITIHDEFGNLINSFYPNQDSTICVRTLEIQEDTLWAVCEQEGRLLKMNKTDGTIIGSFELPTFSLGGDPNNYGITFDGTHLWNIEYTINGQSILYKIDPFSGNSLDTTFIPITGVGQIEAINNRIFGIRFRGDELFEINVETGDTSYVADWCINEPFQFDFFDENNLIGISSRISVGGAQSVYKIGGFDFETITSIETIDSDKSISLSIYPNPTTDLVNVKLNEYDDWNLKIFDSTGKQISSTNFSDNYFQKDIANYPVGIYYFRITSRKNTFGEFIIKR